MHRLTSRVALALACFGALASASSVHADIINSTGTVGGYPVSASASFSFSADTLKLTLTNSTPTTYDASQLLSGFEFLLPGLTDLTLTAGSAKPRTIAADGSYDDSKAVDLLTAGNTGGPTWSLESLGNDYYRVIFQPDADYAIVGPPTNGGYADANGSILGNGGHSVFAAESVSLTLSATNLTRQSAFGDTWFLYGTNLQSNTPGDGTSGDPPPAPEPASLGLLGLGALALLRRRR